MLRRIITVLVALALGLGNAVHAAVPTPADIAACNKEAEEAVRKGSASPGSASPNTKDESRAAEARKGNVETNATGTITQSPNPQLEGMNAEGAKNPGYQAAYRTCMRKSGF